MDHREFDVILYGATGFVGRQATRYLAEQAPTSIRWAIAGRNRARLEALNAGVPILVVDSTDFLQAEALTRRTRVLLSMAGPFALYSDRLVEACVKNLTHYVDISGEVAWVRSLIDRFHERAERDGTRIVPFCGFDSVPVDLGAALLVQQLGASVAEVRAYFELRGGTPNGGTIASACQVYASGADALDEDPFLLSAQSPDEVSPLEEDPTRAAPEPNLGGWIAPMLTSVVDTRVVRRSASLAGLSFAYQEFLFYQGRFARLRAHGISFATRLFRWSLRQRPLRAILRTVMPPGDGPTDSEMRAGYFRCRMLGWADDGGMAVVTIAAEGDPANRITVQCACESALAIACGSDKLPPRAGVLTPSTGIGEALLERLRKQGIIFTAGMM